MKKNYKLSVITPTYNRADKIVNLYNSLSEQTSKDFRWIIIDDGSVDGTEGIVGELRSKKNNFEIFYVKKENGGKHTALNLAFGLLDDGLAMIVDSDDYLIEDAVKTILQDWEKYGGKKICGLCYKKMREDGSDMCGSFVGEVKIANYNDFIINGRISGDKAEVFRADILKIRRYPSYKNERFLGEGVMWSKIAHDYDMVFINKPIYVCEYLEGGLTKSGRNLRIKNPNGGMYHAEEYLDKRYKIQIREKNALLYLTYARFAKKDLLEIYKKSKYKILLFVNFLPSLLLYNYWKRRYKDD